MDSFELNKILGAILGTCIVLLVTSFTAGAIFSPVMPEKPGFEIAVKEEAPAGGKEAAAAPSEPIEKLLQTASVEKGAAAAKKCQRLPHLREGRPQPRRPESVRHRRRQKRRGTRRLQFLGRHEGQGRHLDL